MRCGTPGRPRAQVRIRYRPHELDLEISDDGNGAATHAGGSGHGLAGMRERAVRRHPGGRDAGFTVHARLPVDRTQA